MRPDPESAHAERQPTGAAVVAAALMALGLAVVVALLVIWSRKGG